jgi:hypothetical protein
MDTDDATEPQQATPSTAAAHTAEMKAEEEAPPFYGVKKLPEPKAPQTTQLREPGEVALPSLPTIQPNRFSDDSQMKMKAKAKRASRPASEAQPGTFAVENPSVEPGAVAVQGASTQQKTEHITGLKQPVPQPGAGSAGRSSQPREPAVVAGPATTAKIAPPSGGVDMKKEKVSCGK